MDPTLAVGVAYPPNGLARSPGAWPERTRTTRKIPVRSGAKSPETLTLRESVSASH